MGDMGNMGATGIAAGPPWKLMMVSNSPEAVTGLVSTASSGTSRAAANSCSLL